MLKIYKPSALKELSKRTLLYVLAAILAFTLATASIVYYKSQRNLLNAADCGSVFDPLPTWVTDRVNLNKATYIQVANETGVPWEMLAAIHYRETNMSRINPKNGNGLYQILGTIYSYTGSPISDSAFLAETREAARFVQTKASLSGTGTSVVTPRKLTANDSDINLIKNTLFSYNGRASVYAKQAATYGFSATSQPWEGSPYVMNLFDCKRKAMGIITQDYGGIDGVDTRLGAFTLYARLKGDGYWNSLQVGNLPGCAEATNTRISCIWRLYNPGTSKYTYTASFDLRNSLIAQGYLYQNTAFYGTNPIAPVANEIPVYSLLDNAGGTFLTTGTAEYNALKNAGWRDQGIAFYADPSSSNTGYPVYRVYNPTSGIHAWTSSLNERSGMLQNGFNDEGVAFNQISTALAVPTSPAPVGQRNIYRFGSMPGNTHFWTSDINERDSMIRAGYHYEGVAWRALSSIQTGSTAVYRLYSPTIRMHLFTTDLNEKNTLAATKSWNYEGVAWYSPAKGNPIYRLYSSTTHEHFFTTDSYERSQLIIHKVFNDEGIAWYQP